MSRCAGCGFGRLQAGFRFCPSCGRPLEPAPPAPAEVNTARWTWGDRILLVTAVALGIAILLAIAYLVLGVWLGLTPIEVIVWGLAGWICLRILGFPPRPAAPSLPIRRNPVTPDDAHDAAIGIAAVLGARDAIHRR